MQKSMISTLLPIATFSLTLLIIVLYLNGGDVVEDRFVFPLMIAGVIETFYFIPKIEMPIVRKTLLGIVIGILILLLLGTAMFSFLMNSSP